MNRVLPPAVRVIVLTTLLGSPTASVLAQNRAAPTITTFVNTHCISCHDADSKKGGLDLTSLPLNLTDAATLMRWVQVHDRIRAGDMPPATRKRPSPNELNQVLKTLQVELTAADVAQRKVVLRRINRVEYENTVRDLFGIRADVRGLLLEDATANGFDTNGEALGVSIELMHAYLEAADAVLDTVLGSEKEPVRVSKRFPLLQDVKQNVGSLFRETPEGVAVFNTGYIPSAMRTVRIMTPGTYRVRIHARAFQSDKPVVMAVETGDVITHIRPFRVQGLYDLPPDKMTVVEFEEWFDRYDSVHPKPYGVRGAGQARWQTTSPGIVIGDFEIEGPLEPWPPPSRARLLGKVDPKLGTAADAERILAELLPRAFRRPVKPEETARYVGLVKDALAQGRPFLDALRLGVKAVLSSPAFLFLEEPTMKSDDRRITATALASRLSYFLWSSTPDAALLAAAESGELATPAGLRRQTERLLADPKAAAFTTHFTGQWLNLRDIDFTEPDKALYPEFDPGLKLAMLAETHLFFDEMLHQNRDLREFIDSDWTFLNERLAQHYDLPGVTGVKMRKVKLPADSVRGGLLTQASILKVTANGTNTSPVVRGVWVLSNILGTPTPPPPPNVPAVEPDIRGTKSIREQLAKHRDSSSCAACHRKIDPPGFALEAFDVIGGHRDWYRSLGEGERVDRFIDAGSNVKVRYRKGPTVDASGELPDGRRFADIREFKRLLKADPDGLARCLTEKLLTYGVGRGMGFSDRSSIEAVVAAVRKQQYGFRSLIHEVVQSDIFHRP